MERDLGFLLAEHRPEVPMSGPIRISMIWVFPWRKTETKRNRISGILPKDSLPDCENLTKMLNDVLQKMNFFKDDGHQFDQRVRKFWGDRPGLHIKMTKPGADEVLAELQQEGIIR